MAKSKKKSTQNVENVSGRVIQAGGNVTVNEKSPKTVGEKIAIWVGIVAGVVAIITAIVKLQDSVSTSPPESAIFLGKVVDQNDNGVEAATVYTLRTFQGDTIGFGPTDARGEFNFIVKSKPENSVYILIEKDGVTHQHGLEVLGSNKKLTLSGISVRAEKN